MAKNTTPVFTLNGNFATASIAAANTASDGSGALVTLLTAGTNGTRLDKIQFRNAQITAAVSSAMVVRAFKTDNTGSNPRLIAETTLAAATRSASAIGAFNEVIFSGGFILESGELIKVCQSVYAGAQDLVNVVAFAGDY